jgi:RHS repeat-associated protein
LTLKYSYDAEGKKLAQRNATNVARNEFYQYDAAERLVLYRGKVPPVREAPGSGSFDPLKGASKSQTWTLDPAGNWSETVRNNVPEQRVHSAVNAISSIVGFGPLEYDKNGNLIDDGVYVYAYDFNDRLREVHQKVDDEPVAAYSYDALGRRIARTALEKSTIAQRRFVYYYDGQRIVELRERPNVGDPDEFRAAFAHGTGLDETLVMVRESNNYYYHHSSALSTVALTNQAGTLVERYEYDPYGRTQVLDASWHVTGDVSGVGNVFTFQGREDDAEAGLIYFRLRSLSPLLGRWLSRNPAGYAVGPNLYSAATLVNGASPFGTDG